MIAAIHHAAAGPAWLEVLAAADQWHCPPWEIAPGGRRVWLLRWRFFTQQRLLRMRNPE